MLVWSVVIPAITTLRSAPVINVTFCVVPPVPSATGTTATSLVVVINGLLVTSRGTVELVAEVLVKLVGELVLVGSTVKLGDCSVACSAAGSSRLTIVSDGVAIAILNSFSISSIQIESSYCIYSE